MLKLPEVTICSADSAYVELTAKALTRSQEQIRFGDAILFSDKFAEGPFRHVPIKRLASVQDYSDFCLRDLPGLIATPYVLIVQWDGFVVDPAAWRGIFLKQDYIGAAWHNFGPGCRVGNGGFSLRSQRLLKALSHFSLVPNYWEDRAICHLFRPRLEAEFGIKFASEKIADQFSYEFEFKESFGFHGVHNLWRYMTDSELFETVLLLWTRKLDIWKSLKLISDAYAGGRIAVARDLYAELRRAHAISDVANAAEGIPRMPSTYTSLAELERHFSGTASD